MDPPLAKLAVIRAVVKKTAVAINERGERRDNPQSMWPEVQPRPFYSLKIMISLNSLIPYFFEALTLVPQPNKNPTPNVVTAEIKEFGGAG